MTILGAALTATAVGALLAVLIIVLIITTIDRRG